MNEETQRAEIRLPPRPPGITARQWLHLHYETVFFICRADGSVVAGGQVQPELVGVTARACLEDQDRDGWHVRAFLVPYASVPPWEPPAPPQAPPEPRPALWRAPGEVVAVWAIVTAFLAEAWLVGWAR